MAANDFFSRWAKKTNSATDEVVQDIPPAVVAARPAPTLDDVAELSVSSDFSPFVAQGVDDVVKRLALKKLFSDPRFNIMDGLDTYIEDYNTFVPMTADMVAELNHAKLLMNPLAHLEQPFMQMLETPLPKMAEEDEQIIAEKDDVAISPEDSDADSLEEVAGASVPLSNVNDAVENPTSNMTPTLVEPLLPTPAVPE